MSEMVLHTTKIFSDINSLTINDIKWDYGRQDLCVYIISVMTILGHFLKSKHDKHSSLSIQDEVKDVRAEKE